MKKFFTEKKYKILNTKFLTILFLTLTSNCNGADTFHFYKDNFEEMIQDPKIRKIKDGEGDINNFKDCHWLLDLTDWNQDSDKKLEKSWYRWNVWRSGSVNHHKTSTIRDSENYIKINRAIDNSNNYLIYVGPWHSQTLTQTEGSFPFSKTTTIQKQIRFFAYYPKEGGNVKYQYESMNEQNKNIPEKKFSLSPTAKYAPDRFGLCVVKWTARFGYNAIAEVKSKNIFSKNYLVPTGRIIDYQTKEVIADFSKQSDEN